MTETDALAEEQKYLLFKRIEEIDKKLLQVYSRIEKLEKLREEKIDKLADIDRLIGISGSQKYHIKRIK